MLSKNRKNNKATYYLRNIARQLIPKSLLQAQLPDKLNQLKISDRNYILSRVNYYNKLENQASLSEDAIALKNFKLQKKHRTYFFDTYEYSRYFENSLKMSHAFGDINFVPTTPSIVKSRPIANNNQNSILLKLNKIRHYVYTDDKRAFKDKKNMLVGRMAAHQPQRVDFIEQFAKHFLCDVGQVNARGGNPAYSANWLSISEHLKYKFILCLEGHDVASNLKWVMSSNSVAVMPKPTCETWFMEGRLIPDYHYLEIRSDFSDLEDKLTYCFENPDFATRIATNANAYVEQFRNPQREDLISLLVLYKYFARTGQSEEVLPATLSKVRSLADSLIT